MIEKKHWQWVVLSLAITIAPSLLLAADITPDEAYQRILVLLDKNPARTEIPDPLLYTNLKRLALTKADSLNDEITELQLAILNDKDNDLQIRGIALAGLRHANESYVDTTVLRHAADPDLSVDAAALLAEWGEWDDALPILIEKEYYSPLCLFSAPNLDSILLAESQSASPIGRLSAATFADARGNDTLLHRTALDLIDEYVESNDTIAARAVVDAFTIVKHEDGLLNYALEAVDNDLKLFPAAAPAAGAPNPAP